MGPRIFRTSARAVDALLHRNVGALQLLRDAGHPDPVHDRHGGKRRTGFPHLARRSDLWAVYLNGVSAEPAGGMDRGPHHGPAPRGALWRHDYRAWQLRFGYPFADGV